MGSQRNTANRLKIATSLKNSRLFNYVHKVSIMLWKNYVISIKHFCVFVGHMTFHRNTVDFLKIATSLKENSDIFNDVHLKRHFYPYLVAEIRDIKRCVQIPAFV